MLKKYYLQFTKAIAFTLAETLIVMGIIGVVAALTLPNLNSSTGDKEKVAKVKKIYSNLQDALGRAQVIYGPIDEWCQNLESNFDCTTRMAERITEFMKISKNCGFERNKGCFAAKECDMDKSCSSGRDDSNSDYKVILADGTSLAFYYHEVTGYIFVDIDGPNKGESAYNRDLFEFEIDKYSTNDELVPEGQGSWHGNFEKFNCNPTSCTAWVIQNGNMDYLKVGSDGKCANGTKLNWTTQTSCK